MKKTLIALSTGFFLASGAALAETTALDIEDQPERSTSQDLVPNVGLVGGSDYTDDEFAAEENYGDQSPEISTEDGTIGIDYLPTASTEAPGVIDEENAPDSRYGDEAPLLPGQPIQ